MRHPAVTPALPLLFLCLALPGCGDDNPLERQAVSGDIRFDGEPLKSGTIEFHPQGGAATMSGAPIVDGHYAVEATRGLPVGTYLVRIFAADTSAPPEALPGESNKLAKELIPAQYNLESQERVEVKAGEENKFDFDIPR